MKAFIAALLLSIFLLPGVVSAEETKKEYVVTFKEKSKTNFKPTEQDISSITSEGGIVKEVMALGFAVADLTEKQADDIKKKDNVVSIKKNISFKTKPISEYGNNRAITLIDPALTWWFYGTNAYNEEIPFTNKWGFTGKGVNIAVIDTGVGVGDELPNDIPDKNIKGRIDCFKQTPEDGVHDVRAKDYEEAENGLCNENYKEIQGPHGTNVTDIIVGKHNGIAFDGVAPDAGIYAISYIKHETEPGDDKSDVDDTLRSLNWVYNHNAEASDEDKIHIINMSFVMKVPEKDILEEMPQFQEAINRLYKSDVLLVAGSGNDRKYYEDEDNPNFVSYPAAFKNVIAVGALTTGGDPASFSQQGPKLDLVAPGKTLLLAVPNKYDTKEAYEAENEKEGGFWIPFRYKELDELQDDMSGTSFASPMVAGAAALLKEQYPQATAADLKWMLYYNANVKPNDEKKYDWGDISQLTRTNERGYGTLQAKPFEWYAESRGYREDGIGSEDNILYSIDADQIVYNYPSVKAPKREYGVNGTATLKYYWGFFKSSTKNSENAEWAGIDSETWVKRNDLKQGVKFYLFNDTMIERAYPRATMPAGTVTVTRQSDRGETLKTDYEYDGNYAWITGDSGSFKPFKNTTDTFYKTEDTKAYLQPVEGGYLTEVDVPIPSTIEPDKVWSSPTGKKWYRIVTDEGIAWLYENEMRSTNISGP